MTVESIEPVPAPIRRPPLPPGLVAWVRAWQARWPHLAPIERCWPWHAAAEELADLRRVWARASEPEPDPDTGEAPPPPPGALLDAALLAARCGDHWRDDFRRCHGGACDRRGGVVTDAALEDDDPQPSAEPYPGADAGW